MRGLNSNILPVPWAPGILDTLFMATGISDKKEFEKWLSDWLAAVRQHQSIAATLHSEPGKPKKPPEKENADHLVPKCGEKA